jgi:primary-amine oxidase
MLTFEPRFPLSSMPVEHLRVTFKPQSFFKMNPALDVPGAQDKCSKAAFGDGVQANGANGPNGTNGANGANGHASSCH